MLLEVIAERETISREDVMDVVAMFKTTDESPKAPGKVELSFAGAAHEASRTESSEIALNRPRT